MPTKSSKLIPRLLRGILLSVLLCILGCIGFGALTRIAGNGEQAPIRSLRVTIDESQQEELFGQLRKFADKHGFEYQIADFNTNGELFQVYMSRDDMEIISRNPFDSRIFRISFYDKYQGYPVGEETVDELLADLKVVISEIPNALITEKQNDLTITLDKSQREELFTQLRKLADTYSLEFTLSFSSDKTVFFAEIAGDGFHVTVEPVVGSPEEITVVLFLDYYKVPTVISQETADEVFDELKRLLGEIPNTTIIEE